MEQDAHAFLHLGTRPEAPGRGQLHSVDDTRLVGIERLATGFADG